jgi:hypothetical protein
VQQLDQVALRVRDVLRHALARFQENGVVTLVNTFRWVAARRPL